MATKKGDLVECILTYPTDSPTKHKPILGRVYEIVSIDKANNLILKGMGKNGFLCSRFELYKGEKMFKLGDHVKLIDNESGSINNIGDIGEITQVEEGSSGFCFRVTVEGIDNECNWSKPEELELVDDQINPKAVDLINSLQLDNESINTWKNGVARALKRYVEDGTVAKGQHCTNCDSTNLIYQEGCLICQ